MGGLVSKMGSMRFWKWDRHCEPLYPDLELQQREFESAVIEATEIGDVETLQNLHEQECFVFWGGVDSITTKPPLLHRATAKGHKSVVEYLLHLGVDVDATDSSGMTVLHIACKMLENTCLPPLLTRSCDIDKRDVWGRTPLIKALVYRNVEAAQMLLEKGANPNATDIYGMTPLTTAIDYNMMDVLSLLVLHGADVNLITHQHHGRCSGPPLYLAINNQNLAMVKELIRLGAGTQPRIQNYNTNSSATLSYIGLGSSQPSSVAPSLQYSDAVSLSMSEILRRGEENISESSNGIKILMEVLAAHGHPLELSPDVLVCVLLNSRKYDFSMLLYKLQICCSSCSEDIVKRLMLSRTQSHQSGGNSLQQLLKQPPRLVSSLQNQARRAARKALMASYHNVTWACKRLQCPPALKTVMLLKDVNKAFSHPTPQQSREI